MTVLHNRLGDAMKILLNGGPEDREAAMGIITRMRTIRDQKRNMLRDLYSKHAKVLTSETSKGKIEFDG